MQPICSCSAAPTLIFACSGSSDVGELADRAARKMTKENIGKMFCLAGIGGKVSGMIKSTEAASSVLVIDGCPLSCGKKTLEQAGLNNFSHLQLSEIGMVKGKTQVSDENIEKIITKASSLIKK
jgi:uncharacterized metal-binding protein